MKFRAPTIVFNAFWKAGLIFGSAFAVGFFAWPWVAYGAVTLHTFEGYSLGALNGQDSWSSVGAAVVSKDGSKTIELDGADTATKAFNIANNEVLKLEITPSSNLDALGRYNYIRLCNSSVSCVGSGNAGFVISIEDAGGDFFNVYNLHATTSDLALTNIGNSATTTLYFAFVNGEIGIGDSCGNFGCSFTWYDPFYETDTVDDIDNFMIESSNGTADMYYDNIETVSIGSILIEEGDSPLSTSTNWQYADGFSWQYQTCYMTNGVPESCSIEVHWRAVNDGNVAYLMSENRAIEYDSVEMDGATGRMDWLEVPATSTPGYATFDIMIENLNGYYTTDEEMTLGWKAFESVYVIWVELGQTPDPRTANLFPNCGDVCTDVATDTDETLWQWMASGVSCGFQSAICYLLKPSDLITYQFVVLGDKIQTVWPYSLVTSVTGNIYTQDENGETIRAYETSTTTLDMSVAFPNGTDPIPVISNTMFEGKTEIENFIGLFKEKVSFLLYALLFFYMFVRVMGTTWLPTVPSRNYSLTDPTIKQPTAPSIESSQVWAGNFLTGYSRKTKNRKYYNTNFGKVYLKK